MSNLTLGKNAAAATARLLPEPVQLGGSNGFEASDSQGRVQAARWRPAQRAAHRVRGDDLYETPPCAVHALLRTGEIDRLACGGSVWEPCAGRGAISRELIAAGFRVVAHDLVRYPGTDDKIEAGVDFFLEWKPPPGVTAIATNPPYKLADDLIRPGLDLGLPVVVLLRLMALEGSGRSDLIDRHLRRVWLGIERLPMMHREGWQGPRTKSGGAPFAWFCFEPVARQGPIEITRISWREAPQMNSRP